VSKVKPPDDKEASSTRRSEPSTNGDSEALKNKSSAILDRSRAELRLPADLLAESLRIAYLERYQAKFDRLPEDSEKPDDLTVKRLEGDGVFRDGKLDPIAFELLDVVNTASLTITVDLRFGSQSSVPGIWATPKLAVASSSLDPNYVEFFGAEVGQLTQLLAQHVVLRSPKFVAQAPISVNTKALVNAEAQRNNPEEALQILMDGGLNNEQAQRVLVFQGDEVRRWRISSRWSTERAPEGAELRGLDAGPDGQWLLALTGTRAENGQMTFTPQGHGDMMKALRSILPRNWVGTPLSKQPE